MINPLISVCIVTFNHEQYIRSCIMSVIVQEIDVPFEILVGDDQSEDGTSAIVGKLVNEYPYLIRYFRHTSRLGPAKNIQAIIRQSRGKFIAHLDGDDFWLPGKLAAQISFMEQHPDCPAVYANALAIRDDGITLGVFNNPQPERFDINALMRRGNFLNHSSMLYRASLRENILAMSPPFLDYRIHLSHARHGAIGYLNQTLVCYRVNSISSMINHANDHVRQLYWEALLDVPRDSINKNNLAEGMAEFIRSVFFRSIRIKNISLFFRWLPNVLQASPVGNIKMALLIFISIFRVGCRECVTKLCACISRNHFKIFYHR